MQNYKNLRSALITAKAPSAARSEYTITVGSHINSDLVAVNSGAKDEYDNMIKAYAKLKASFQEIGKILVEAAKKSDGKTKRTLQSVAKKCTNQGTYCGNRSNQLKELFKYAKLESKINELEAALESIQTPAE